MSDSGRCVSDLDRPWNRRSSIERSTLGLAWLANERDAPAIGRPNRLVVIRRIRVEVANGLRGEIEDADKSVVASIRDEGQRVSVVRPDDRRDVAARVKHQLGFASIGR